jgi:hypothetical protein
MIADERRDALGAGFADLGLLPIVNDFWRSHRLRP